MVEIGIVGCLLYLGIVFKNFLYYLRVVYVYKVKQMKEVKGIIISLLCYFIYNFQGWAGLQNRTLILMWIASAFTYNFLKLGVEDGELVG
jgi:hypothetical protein